MSFEIGDRVVYLGGDNEAFCEAGEVGTVTAELSEGLKYDPAEDGAVEVTFDSLAILSGRPGQQFVLAGCLEKQP